MFSESLTVRILGDSAHLRSELSQVVDQLRGLQERVAGLQNAGQQIGQAFSRVSTAVRPLQQLSQLLTQISNQVSRLGQQPVNLNVQPALQSLQRLMQMIDAAMARLRMLATMPVGGPMIPGLPGGGGPRVRLASGGLVVGPAGTDRVPAMLTAGEFVLSREATLALGAGFLGSLNATAPSSATSAPINNTATTNHFGGINVTVQQLSDVNALVRDLRLQGVHLRNRRG